MTKVLELADELERICALEPEYDCTSGEPISDSVYQSELVRFINLNSTELLAALRIPAPKSGWVSVPREPTEAMLLASRDWSDKLYGKPIGSPAAKGCYAAMLEAAAPLLPLPPDEQGGGTCAPPPAQGGDLTEKLHAAICNAVGHMNLGDYEQARLTLRVALVKYADEIDAALPQGGERK